MIRLSQDPRAAANIEFASQSVAAMPKPREVVIARKSTLIEAAAVLLVICLAAAGTVRLVNSGDRNPAGWLFALLIVVFLVRFVAGEIFREFRNRSLLAMGTCSAGNVISQRWVKEGRSRRNEIVYEFPVGGAKPMRAHGTDLTKAYCTNMPLLVFYAPDDISRHVAICCTRWRIRSRNGSLFEP